MLNRKKSIKSHVNDGWGLLAYSALYLHHFDYVEEYYTLLYRIDDIEVLTLM